MDNSKNKQIENLALNKMGRSIKKTPLHQLNYCSRFHEPETPVYNISKEHFKSFVQQLTGSPNHPPHNLPNNTPKPIITRLQKNRPPPLSLVRPAVSVPHPVQVPTQVSISIPPPVRTSFPVSVPAAPKAPPPSIIDFPRIPIGFKEPSPTPTPLQPSTVAPEPSTDALPWDMPSSSMAESPISAFVRHLLEVPNSNGDHFHLQQQPQQVPRNVQPQQHPLSLLNPPSSNVIAPLVSENVTITTNSIVPVIASNSVPFEQNGTTIQPMHVDANVDVTVNATTNSLTNVNVSSNGNKLFQTEIPFPSPQSPYGPLFPTDIHFPSPPSPPLFPPDF